MEGEDSSYANVRGLTRGFTLLKALNAQESGRATIRELSDQTGLHRTTVRRLLETMLTEGFVRRSESDDSYRLTIAVRTLSEGFTDDEWIATVATPLMKELTQKLIWPSDLATPKGDAMIIRETTHRFSSLSFHRSMVGRQLPMLSSAAGRTYFAYCNDKRRESILIMLRAGTAGPVEMQLAKDESYLNSLIKRVHADGFGVNDGDLNGHKKTGAIALPIWHHGEVLATLNVVYLSSVITPSEAARLYLTDLHSVTTKLGRLLEGTPIDMSNGGRY